MVISRIKRNEFEIPSCIQKLVVDGVTSELDTVVNLYEKFNFGTEEWFFSKYSTLIHLDEAEEVKRLVGNDLEKVRLLLKSRKDKFFSFKMNQYEVITLIFKLRIIKLFNI